jgi:hypothetical protein
MDITMEYFTKDYIVDLFADLYDLDSDQSRYYFENGGCVELAKIAHYFCPESMIMCSMPLEHCAIAYGDNLYDATGIIDSDTFNIASKEDITYMEDKWGREIRIKGQHVSDYMIGYIRKCQEDGTIKTINFIKENNKINSR